MIWRTARRELPLGSRPLIMGILNLTPDSFSDGGRYPTVDQALEAAHLLEAQGADLLDLGAESTRPGAEPVEVEEEWKRLAPVLAGLASRTKIPLSIDTYKPEIARRALEEGAEIINDVSGGQWVPGMIEVIARHRAGYVLMHAQGNPATMQLAPHYENVVNEVLAFFHERIAVCAQHGIERQSIAVDPGFGFGKTLTHNVSLLQELARLKLLGHPILVGLSRKSFLKKIAGQEHIAVSTITAQTWAASQGAHIWRVHDVPSSVAAAQICAVLNKEEEQRTIEA
jgi:dihydropteroate synthase